ncbi:MAG: hypothetical protein ACR2QK_07915 [Acidimicrobiales bacterium]
MPITHFTISTGRVRNPGSKMVAVAAVMVGLTALLGVPLAAQQPDVPPPRGYGESGVNGGVVNVRARADWLPANYRGSGSSSCTTSSARIIVEDDFVQPVNREWRVFSADGSIPFTGSPDDLPSSLPTYMRHFSPTGRWYAVTCDGVTTVVPEGGPPVTIAGLTQQALDQLDPAEPELAITPEELHFTQLQSWLAIEPSYWNAARQATAAAGRVRVTATARAQEVQWEMGDGESFTCDGAGTVWQAGLDDEAATCSHIYRRTSVGQPGDSFDITSTVRFEVTVASTAPGSYGPFQLERTTVESIQVGEIQAVNN